MKDEGGMMKIKENGKKKMISHSNQTKPRLMHSWYISRSGGCKKQLLESRVRGYQKKNNEEK